MKYTLSILALSLALVGCDVSPSTQTNQTTPPVKTAKQNPQVPQEVFQKNEETPTPNSTKKTMTDNLTATFKTTKGDIVLQLHPDEAPNITQNFVDLAKAGKYDKTIFHRVIDGFMIQGGDYENFNGTGGQAAKGGMIADEFSDSLSHVRGVISMANRGPGTNGSQFFIMHADAPHLDGKHSIFGQVIEGMDVVDAIATAEKDRMDKPVEDVVVKTIEIK